MFLVRLVASSSKCADNPIHGSASCECYGNFSLFMLIKPESHINIGFQLAKSQSISHETK